MAHLMQNIPSHNEYECVPCIPVARPQCTERGMDPVTVRRPLIVYDSTFDVRPTSLPGMVLNSQDKKVRYQVINYERPRNIDKMWPKRQRRVKYDVQIAKPINTIQSYASNFV